MSENSGCHLCPRACGADRSLTTGACGADNSIRAARAMPHFWEEPCISGSRGSGAIFFSCCTLGCVYCQNKRISGGELGLPISPERLYDIFFELEEKGVHNINLVSADQYAELIAPVLRKAKKRLSIPVVFNCSGYESDRMLELLDGLVDVYLPDFKYSDCSLAQLYSGAPDYPQVASRAVFRMLSSVGAPRFDGNGMLIGGMIVRHLVLPGHRQNSLGVLRILSSLFRPDDFLFSLMSQYTPNGDARAPARRLTSFEYKSVSDAALEYGFRGYFQEISSSDSAYTPDFDGTGILKV